MKSKANIFWCTGLSGSGKSTLADHVKSELEKSGFKTLIIDGDVVRAKYNIQLGFNRKDIEKNNLNVLKLCEIERYNHDVIIVPIISPINEVRLIIRKLLGPSYHLVYVSSDIDTLTSRDTKGLYKKAIDGTINDLIGFSKKNPYDIPKDYDLIINTGKDSDIKQSKQEFTEFVFSKVLKPLFSNEQDNIH
jgi:adenylylsulfate kinase